MIFPSNSVDILEESIYKRQLTLNVTAVNGEIVPSDYVGKYSSAINWSSNDSEAVSVLAGYIEAKGNPANAVMISAVSADDSDIYDSMEYATIGLDITVDGKRANGGTVDIVTHAFSAGTYALSLFDESGIFTSDYMSSHNLSGSWTLEDDYVKGEIPGNRDMFGTSASYLRLTDKTNYTATISRYSQMDTPVVCNVISINEKAVAVVHFNAGYKYQFT